MVLPTTAPATVSDLSAGTLAEARPPPVTVRSDSKSPETARAFLVAFFPLTTIAPMLAR